MAESAPLRLAIDLGALRRNWERLARTALPAECAAVVKADAYGIGIECAVPALAEAGCRTFFVALPDEGERVRNGNASAEIYVLNGFLEQDAECYRASRLRPVLNSPEDIDAWTRSGGGPCAIQVDTGMNRLGLSLHEALEISSRPERLAALSPQLLISHLACADTPAHPLNQAQLAMFVEIRNQFPSLPASLANSAGIALGPDFHFNLVRPGVALYGAGFAEDRPAFENVVTAQAQILQIREAAAGETVGYGAALRLARESQIAILSAGYADGYLRSAGSSDGRSGAEAFLRGHAAPLLGRVSMDLIAIDVTDVPGAARGQWVELFGPNIPIDDVAEAAGTIPYELLTGLSRRAHRVYLGKSEPS